MAYNTAILQGRFTSTGSNVTLSLPSNFDWIRVYNETVLNASALASDWGAEFYFQRGMTNGRGIEYRKLGTVANDPLTTLQISANSGFILIDTSGDPVQAAVAQTAITNVAAPVVSTASTAGLVTGSIVRLVGDTDQTSTQGFDFEVASVVANTSFTMRYSLANAPGVAGAGDGSYRIVDFDANFYPRRRNIVNISQASQMVVTVSVQHGLQQGHSVRLHVSSPFGMVEADGLLGTVVSSTASTVTLDIDSTNFTAFAWPAAADVPFTFAELIPVGMDSAEAINASLDLLDDATVNNGVIGVELVAGANSPAGQNNDVIYWVAGKSFSVGNE